MLLKRFIKTTEKKRQFAHVCAGIVILIHAYEKYESGHGPYLFFAIAGIVFITIALLHPVIERKAPWIDGVFFGIESILSFAVAYDYFHMGKMRLPVAYLLLAIFQLFMAFRRSKKGMEDHKLHSLEKKQVI